MKRRDFLARAIPAASTLPFLLGGLPLRTNAGSSLLQALASTAAGSDRVLVLIQLNGGNDGLNMVIPRDQYAALSIARGNVMIPEGSVLPLTAVTGLHPAMSGLQAMYQSGKLVVVQSVSYPNPNFSHFRATDIWLTGADYNQTVTSGVIGRYLDAEFPGFPVGYPIPAEPDPPSISIGSIVSPGLQGPHVPMGMAISNPNSTYLLPGGGDVAPNTPAGHELTFIRQVAEQTQVYSAAVRTAYGRVANIATYPTGNSLADQLKIVARLVAGGLKTRVYVVSLGGFDTHSAQVDAGDHTIGTHATLMTRISGAVAAFQADLLALGAEDRVLGMTFSEFGRRIKSNASGGTDHGTAVPMFLFGKHVNPGILGTNPVLGKIASPVTLSDIKDNLDMQFDYRRVYGTILRDWFGASTTEVQAVVNTSQFSGALNSMGFIAPGAVLAAGDSPAVPDRYLLEQNYPNPFNPETTIRFQLPESRSILLEVYNAAGQRVGVLAEGEWNAGSHEVRFDASGLASGTYFYRLRAGEFVETKKAVLVR